MKKLFFGIIIGLVLSFSLSAYGDSFLGKTVDTIYPLFIDGTRCPVDAISIEGTSYIPVRKAGEIFGYDVNFENEQIFLTKAETVQIPTINNPSSISKFIGDVKSNTVKLTGESVIYFVKDGEGYAVHSIFDYDKDYDGVNFTINFLNKTIVIPKNQGYSTGIEGYMDGPAYIKLSAVGMKAEIMDNVLWVEFIE